jgi:hypothetical protein
MSRPAEPKLWVLLRIGSADLLEKSLLLIKNGGAWSKEPLAIGMPQSSSKDGALLGQPARHGDDDSLSRT